MQTILLYIITGIAFTNRRKNGWFVKEQYNTQIKRRLEYSNRSLSIWTKWRVAKRPSLRLKRKR